MGNNAVAELAIAVIPARGGSKRIPRKNIRPFAGKPMIAYAIETALASGLFESVIVSTDDEEVAALSRSYGAEVPFLRPVELADDYTGTDAVIANAIKMLNAHGRFPQYVCGIYATTPFLKAEYLVQGYDKLITSNKHFVIAITSFPSPIQRALRVRADGALEPFQPEHVSTRSQDLEPAFHDAGQFYWGRAQAFLDGIEGHSEASLAITLPRHSVQDIDTPEDWLRAELMYRAMQLADADS